MEGMKTRTKTKSLVLIGAFVCAAGIMEADSISEARDVFKQVIQLKTLLSEERNQWVQEKTNIEDQLAIIGEEARLLEEKIKSLQDTVTKAETEREIVLDKIDDAKAAAAAFSGVIGGLEVQASEVVKYLPGFILQELAPLIQRLPKDPSTSKTALSQRMQTVIGVLTQIEKFNTTLTSNSEIKELPGGVTAEVKTLYVGLGGAYFSDADGKYGGFGRPGASGWEWTTVDASGAETIARAIAVYEAKREPAFVAVPARVD